MSNVRLPEPFHQLYQYSENKLLAGSQYDINTSQPLL